MESEPSARLQGDNAAPPQNINPREMRNFIVEIANLPDLQRKDKTARDAWGRFSRKFAPLVAPLRGMVQTLSAEDGSSASPAGMQALLFGAWIGNPYAGAAHALSVGLRSAWEKPTQRDREVAILAIVADMAQLYATGTDRRFALVQGPIGQALLEAIHAADLMRVCLNPGCPARYFIADRRTQKFCSEKCAEYAQREYKRRWWNDHGSEWRQSSQKRRKSRRRRPAARK